MKFNRSRVAALRLFLFAAMPFFLGATLSLRSQDAGTPVGETSADGVFRAHIKSWDLPFPNGQPHGIFFAQRNQSAWFSAEGSDLLARFDSKAQKFEPFHLRPGTKPYGLVEHSGSGVQSTLYFVSHDGGYVGEFDPETRDVREFHIPGGKVHLEDLVFDHNGVVWFTIRKAQPPEYPQGSKLGRLNLFSSEIRLTTGIPSDVDPLDLAVDSKGNLFFTETGAARVGSVEPEGMKVTEHDLPNRKSTVSGIAITPDDALWLTDPARGVLIRYDLASDGYQEWPSPGGAHSRPEAIATAKGVIWYAETGSSPNAIVRFNPATKSFASWPLAAGGTVGRISAQPDGALWFTLPTINKIGELIPDDK